MALDDDVPVYPGHGNPRKGRSRETPTPPRQQQAEAKGVIIRSVSLVAQEDVGPSQLDEEDKEVSHGDTHDLDYEADIVSDNLKSSAEDADDDSEKTVVDTKEINLFVKHVEMKVSLLDFQPMGCQLFSCRTSTPIRARNKRIETEQYKAKATSKKSVTVKKNGSEALTRQLTDGSLPPAT
ncbi:hypothetical protein GN244_ATG07262 [Phytophthora infestans]|uniref:Uncharacterized protein n=1 Tax=Phytophthora infestans TaxID=4787 RepID=A0A833S4X4_PHYIN|nr:hypothetical protein GN244_ATG07262 [Phytophthora infestans]